LLIGVGEERPVQTYALYIEDDRYSVPTLLFVTANDDSAIRRIANEKLSEPHHKAVEVLEGEQILVRIERGGSS
jgi:hypothetical protein